MGPKPRKPDGAGGTAAQHAVIKADGVTVRIQQLSSSGKNWVLWVRAIKHPFKALGLHRFIAWDLAQTSSARSADEDGPIFTGSRSRATQRDGVEGGSQHERMSAAQSASGAAEGAEDAENAGTEHEDGASEAPSVTQRQQGVQRPVMTEADEQKASSAYMLLQQLISEELAALCFEYETVDSLWRHLCDRFVRKAFINVSTLLAEWTKLKQGEDEPVETFMGRVTTLAAQLEAGNRPCGDRAKAEAIYYGLNSQWSTIKLQWYGEHAATNGVPPYSWMAHTLGAIDALRQQNAAREAEALASTTTAMVAQVDQRAGGGAGGRGGRGGHSNSRGRGQRDGSKQQGNRGNSSGGSGGGGNSKGNSKGFKGACFACGEIGHSRADCQADQGKRLRYRQKRLEEDLARVRQELGQAGSSSTTANLLAEAQEIYIALAETECSSSCSGISTQPEETGGTSTGSARSGGSSGSSVVGGIGACSDSMGSGGSTNAAAGLPTVKELLGKPGTTLADLRAAAAARVAARAQRAVGAHASAPTYLSSTISKPRITLLQPSRPTAPNISNLRGALPVVGAGVAGLRFGLPRTQAVAAHAGPRINTLNHSRAYAAGTGAHRGGVLAGHQRPSVSPTCDLAVIDENDCKLGGACKTPDACMAEHDRDAPSTDQYDCCAPSPAREALAFTRHVNPLYDDPCEEPCDTGGWRINPLYVPSATTADSDRGSITEPAVITLPSMCDVNMAAEAGASSVRASLSSGQLVQLSPADLGRLRKHLIVHDTGAGLHCTFDASCLYDITKCDVTVKYGDRKAEGHASRAGKMLTETTVGGKKQLMLLTNVLHLPGLRFNLFSHRHAKESNGLHFVDSIDPLGVGYMADKQGRPVIEFGCRLPSGLRAALIKPLPPPTQSDSDLAYVAAFLTDTPELLHARMGHCSMGALAAMVRHDMVPAGEIGLTSAELLAAGSKHNCEACIMGKHVSRPLRPTGHRAEEPMALVHIDTHGPEVRSSTGKYYGVVAVDDYSGFVCYATVATKSAVPAAVIAILNSMERTSGKPLKAVRTDNGTEYCNKTLAEFFSSHSPPVLHETSAPYTPEQNGTAERYMRTLKGRARTMLAESGLPARYWHLAMETACHVNNRLPAPRRTDPTKPPFWLFSGKQPSIAHMRVWGSAAYAQVPSTKQRGFQPVSRAGVLVGYEGAHAVRPHAYKVLLPDGSIITSTNVKFNERSMPQKGGSGEPITAATGVLADDDKYATITVNLGQSAPAPVINNPGEAAAKVQGAAAHAASKSTKTSGSKSQAGMSTPAVTPHSQAGTAAVTSPSRTVGSWHTAVGPPMATNRRTGRANAGTWQSARLTYGEDFEQIASMPAAAADHPYLQHANPLYGGPASEDLLITTGGEGEPYITGSYAYINLVIDMAKSGRTNITFEPTDYKQAMASPEADKWALACTKEFTALTNNGTWELVSRPRMRKVIPCKWVFKIKADGTYKARLVVKGFHQREGIDYTELFAPVSSYPTLRSVLALAATDDLDMIQLDIATAFLHGNLDEEIYMEQPEGFEEGSNQVCLLRKALYGLKQAPRQWWQRLKQKLIDMGFKPLRSDPSVYIRLEPDGTTTVVATFVDDLLGAGKVKYLTGVKGELQKDFPLTEGDLSRHVGFEIARDRDAGTITLSQTKQILALVDKYGLSKAAAKPTPMAAGTKLTREGTPLDRSARTYAELVGSLNWFANTTRGDISFVTSQLSSFLSSPTQEHWNAALHVLRYLLGTADWGLVYKRGTASALASLHAFCDADYANSDLEKRCSITGFVVMLGGAAVSWGSRKQKSPATSTAEAEYVAACTTTKEVVWISNLLSEIGYSLEQPVTIYSDNQAAISITKDPILSQRTKHIDIQYHYTRDCVEQGKVMFEYVTTKEQIADFLTKPLATELFEACRAGMGMMGT